MADYRHRRYHERQRRLKYKRIRFIIILLVLIAAVAFGIKIYQDKKNGGEPAVPPVTTMAPSASPDASASMQPAVSPDVTPAGTANPNETASPAPTDNAEREIDMLKVLANHDGVKTAYLTFDDGPNNSVTPRVLDILRKYNVKATFFEVGSLIEKYPDMSRRVYEEGHLLANHSYSHIYKDIYVNETNFMNEVKKTEDLIKGITGETDEQMFKLFRFPGGSYNAGTWGANKQKYKELLKTNNYYHCDWNALNGDAEKSGLRTVDELVARIKSTTKEVEDVVILMHDAPAKTTTADALPSIIEYLISEGYTFARMDNEKGIY